MDIALLIVLILCLAVTFIVRVASQQSTVIKEVSGSSSKRSTRTDVSRESISYRSVSIVCDSNACNAAISLADRQFLMYEAPILPLPNCTAATCACKYIHHQDRRNQNTDRRTRLLLTTDTSEQGDAIDRRKNNGRRRSDWKYA